MSQDEQDPAEGAAAAEPATNETADSAPTLRQRAEARLRGLSICPEISCTSSNRWPDGVVPFTMKLGAFYVNFIEFIISHVYAFRVGVGIHLRLNF